MQQGKPLPYSFDCIDSGVDWMTATGRGRDVRPSFDAVGEQLLETEAAAGVEVCPAAVRDYSGYRARGVFYGRRRDDSIIVLSGPGAPPHWKKVAQAASNVSRLDLQVTVWTHGEQPALSRWYWQRAKRLPPKRGRPRSLSLIQTHPQGDTLYVGKRQSDSFGRVYDYASAHRQGEARTIWRYEVEFKRVLALRHSRGLLGTDDPRSYAEQLVGTWCETRGIHRTWCSPESTEPQYDSARLIERDVLSWFRTSMSKTVAKAIRRYGVAAVLDSLQLSQYVIPSPRKESNTYATLAPQAVHGDDRRRDAPAANSDSAMAAWRDSLARINSDR